MTPCRLDSSRGSATRACTVTVITDCAAFASLDQSKALAAFVHEHVTAP